MTPLEIAYETSSQNSTVVTLTRSNRLTKREKRLLKQQGVIDDNNQLVKPIFNIKQRVKPLTENQSIAFKGWDGGNNLLLHGIAGTGKTFISLYLALNELLQSNSRYNKIYIIRSVVPTRDMGFLPGNHKEKTKVYESPYYMICNQLFGRGDAYDILKLKNHVEFMSTSFIRGTTLNDCIIIVDEINNMTFHELDSVITRLGDNCRAVFCGDFRQSDLTKDSERKGLREFMKIIKAMPHFTFVDFGVQDIVRSGLVKDYIIAKDKLGIT